MAKDNNLTDFLTDIADTIRTKTGETGLINPQDFSSLITDMGNATLLTGICTAITKGVMIPNVMKQPLFFLVSESGTTRSECSMTYVFKNPNGYITWIAKSNSTTNTTFISPIAEPTSAWGTYTYDETNHQITLVSGTINYNFTSNSYNYIIVY